MKTNSISAALAVHARTITTRHLIFRGAWLWTGFLAFATIALGPRPAQAAITEAWVQRYGSEAGSQDGASKVVTDAAGNVIVAGSTVSQAGSRSEMLVIKYSGAGQLLWTNRYGPANSLDVATAMALDGRGNVVVTGYSDGAKDNADYYTAKYAAINGALLWEKRYGGPADSYHLASAVAVDTSGNVVVTGTSYGTNSTDSYKAKYAAADGALL